MIPSVQPPRKTLATSKSPQIAIQFRQATPLDFPRLKDIEVASNQLFRALSMDSVAEDDPPTDSHLTFFMEAGNALVACTVASGPSSSLVVGYVLFQPFTITVFIHQISIDPAYARQSIGARMLEVVKQWAKDRGLQGLSLTTFKNVEWNAPYYRRLGFVDMECQDLEKQENSQLKEFLEQERRNPVLSSWERIAMRMDFVEAQKMA